MPMGLCPLGSPQQLSGTPGSVFYMRLPMPTEPKTKMNPGSDEALDAGCRCAVIDNNHGRRTDDRWSINMDCPIHGETDVAPPTS